MSRKPRSFRRDPAAESFQAGLDLVAAHPLFGPLLDTVYVCRQPGNLCPPQGLAVVTASGSIHIHPQLRAPAEQWAYVLAHCLLHLGLEHVEERPDRLAWNAACDAVVTNFLRTLRFGAKPTPLPADWALPAGREDALYELIVAQGLPDALRNLGTAGPGALDLLPADGSAWCEERWSAAFAEGLSQAVRQAVDVAGGSRSSLLAERTSQTPGALARNWFISKYPLLGSLAAAFKLIEDAGACRTRDVSVAAVDVLAQEIFLNPAAGLDLEECRFVIAHELLHVGLRHDARCAGRDPFLWNVACDYVINGWLVELGVGHMPRMGLLYDAELRGESAETIYHRLAVDLRRARRLRTFRGAGACDILEPRAPEWWQRGEGVSLDEFCRRSLVQGLAYCECTGRGLLPAGLAAEIRALDQPPIPWDVELARWFDAYFEPLASRRTYARPSRRQAATPDIPRPRWFVDRENLAARTFGVVLDTSGSMDARLLGKALGAIASYCLARDVPFVRLVFCDAAAYDEGYVTPEALLERVRIRGRGGTVLQPGVALLERAQDFPTTGPLLLITDGRCDRLHVRRDHAYLLPRGGRLPFAPRGPVFYVA
ncbi:MAG: hypothetical protein U0836_18115 [Pirellulales bacterium]